VKAGAEALDAASIAAPTTAAIVLRDRMRKSMVFLQVANRFGFGNCALRV